MLKISQIAAVVFLFAASCFGGDSVLVFNELNYHPANESTQTEWLELRSLQAVDVDIGAWKIAGGIDYTFPEGTVMPGLGYLVVAATPGQISGALGPFTGQLANGGETIRLLNRNGRVMDELTYSDSGDWPVGPDGGGVTLVRRRASAGIGASEWTASPQLGGTPGATNFITTPTDSSLIATRSAWRYRDADAAPPAGWQASAFDDSAWTQANATFGTPGGGATTLTVTANLVERFRASAITGVADGAVVSTWFDSATGDGVSQNASAGGTSPTLRLNVTPSGKPVVRFNGSSELRTTTSPGIGATNGCVYFVVLRAIGAQADGNYLLDRNITSGGAPLMSLKPQSGAFALQKRYSDNSGLGGPVSTTPISTTAFQIVAVRRNRTQNRFEMWVNGVMESTNADTGGALTPDPVNIGRHASNGVGFNGDIAEVLIYNSELSDADFLSVGTYLESEYGLNTAFPDAAAATPLSSTAPTSYFRKAFAYSGEPARTTLRLTHTVADGAVFYLNGTEIYRANMPGGTVIHTTGASSIVANPGSVGPIAVPASVLVRGQNVLAVSLHKASGSTRAFFDAALDSTEAPPDPNASAAFVLSEISGAGDPGFFIEVQNTSTTAGNTSGWVLKTSAGGTFTLPAQAVAAGGFASFTAAQLGLPTFDGLRLSLFAPGGSEFHDARLVTGTLRGLTNTGAWGHPTTATPGSANLVAVTDAIVINEIFYHGVDGSPEQWIELYNKSVGTVDVGGWKFTSGVTFTIPAGTTIPADSYRVIAWDPVAFAASHSGVSALGPWSGSLSGKGEVIRLEDTNGNVADEVPYFDGGRWSEWADGGGSSLELRDPRADNSKGEAWAASDESGNSSWQNFSYSGSGAKSNANDPTNYNEFVFGLLNSGECLMDDISVKDTTLGGVELIQNGTFSGSVPDFWRIIGTHSGSIVGGALKISATGGTEHMSNHAETTLKNGSSYYDISQYDTLPHTYAVSFRAKWLRGSNRLDLRLWHNRLAKQILLSRPATGGTPGAVNGQRVAHIGPTFDALAHAPAVPAAAQTATVTVRVADPDGIGSVQLFTSVNGAAFASTAMTASGGIYTGTVPGQSAGALVQFYIRATDSLGAVSFFPAAGAASRAIIPWQDGRAQLVLGSGKRPHNFRVAMPTADASELYRPENLMGDTARPCTVILDENEIFYGAGVRLKSSEHGRFDDQRCGLTLEFPADQLLFGINGTISLDRSGGPSAGQREILLKRLENTAGGIYASEDDLARIISPIGTVPPAKFNGANLSTIAILSKSRLDKQYLDDQWPGGGSGSQHKYELIYVLTQTIDPAGNVTSITSANVLSAVAELPKIPQDSPGPNGGVPVSSLGSDKESYRWYWLLQNGRDADDYTGIMNVTNAIGQASGTSSFNTLVDQYVDVSTWLRSCIPATLYGVTDNYLSGSRHNTLIYFPPGRKAVLMPWDLDYLQSSNVTTTSLTNGGDVTKFIANPVWKRLFYGHMLDILNRSFNTTYMTTWADHYSSFGTENMTAYVSAYLTQRAAYARSQISQPSTGIPPVSFTRTSPSPTTVNAPFATVTGTGWIDIAEIRLQGSTKPLAVTWTGESTFSLQLPISSGTKTYTLVAFNNPGGQLGTISTTITGGGGIFPAAAGDLIVSELNYNPPGSGDTTEFIELQNISPNTLDLTGCHFDEEAGQGIAYTFPSARQLIPGERIVVAKNHASFLTMYPGASAQLAVGEYDPSSLDNSGESLVLYAASGLEIFRFTYGTTIASANGGGRTLVRVISSTHPDPADYTWRASTANGGNPGTTDASPFTGVPLADADRDGLTALIENALGTSDTVGTPPPWTFIKDAQGRWLFTFPRALNADDVTLTIESTPDLATPFTTAAATLISSTPSGNTAIETYQIVPPGGAPTFFVRLKATLR